jgi:hypothetical protein
LVYLPPFVQEGGKAFGWETEMTIISTLERPLAKLILTSLLLAAFALGPALATPSQWRAEGWKTDFTKSSVQFGEILSGGPPRDGIPSIDAPIFKPASQIADLGPKEPVIRLEINGDRRAYPLRILTWHEIVNDEVGGVPVAVTYCPLCNASIVFERKVDGKLLDFGTTGKLRKSDLVMYDRQTESWWQQFTGEAILGSLQGAELTMLPVRVISFGEFKKNNPEAKVLVPNNPNFRPYGRNPYVNYDSRSAPYPLFTGDLPDNVSPMARVVVVQDGDKKTAVTLSKLRLDGPITLGDLTLSWKKGVNSALDDDQIAQSRDVGSVSVTKKVAGKPQDVVHDVTFAFVYYAFHPEGSLLQ